MGIAVLPPEDFIRKHHHYRQVVLPPNKPSRNPNPNSNPNPNRSSRRRKSSPPPKPASQIRPISAPIRILKRGEDISPARKPEPAPRPDGMFAGSTVISPPASSVPLPAFFTGRRNCGLSTDNNLEIESKLKKVLRLI